MPWAGMRYIALGPRNFTLFQKGTEERELEEQGQGKSDTAEQPTKQDRVMGSSSEESQRAWAL